MTKQDQNQEVASRPPKTFVHGYQPVLVLQDLKEGLKSYRIRRNLMDSHMERTLVSAALSLVMKSPDLQERWQEEHAAVLLRDSVVTRQGCLNVKVGAWILADNMRRHGPNWTAVGAYNAACTQLKGDECENARMVYASKVWRAINGKQKTQQEKQVASVVSNVKHSRIASLDIPDAAPVAIVEASSHE